jgi:hypothetical protein
LSELQNENPEHVFIVRGISRMGFRSKDLLEAHYSMFGKVSSVMVVNSKVPSKVKPFSGGGAQARIRPGSLGFVVMGTVESVARIMAEGLEQLVAGYQIRVERFVPVSVGDSQMSTPPPTVATEERSGDQASSGQTPRPSNSGVPVGSGEEQSTGQVAEEPLSSDSALPKLGVADLHLHDLAGTFNMLVRMMSGSGDVNSLSDQQCAEAVALSRTAQQQLQGVVQSCHNRLRKLDPSGCPSVGLNTNAADGSSPNQLSVPTTDRLMKKQTLGMQLEKVQEEEPNCVFIARKISGMGFQSNDMLAAHYLKYGSVSKVLVAHSKVKPTHGQPRIRPGSLGFVVMACAKSVQAILAEGKEQTVAGHRICVEPFERAVRCQEKTTDVASTNTGGTPASSSFTDSLRSSSGSGSAGGSEKSSDNGSREKLEKDSTDSQQAEKSESGSGSGTENGAAENGAVASSQ